MAKTRRALSLEKVDRELAALEAKRDKLIRTQQAATLQHIRVYGAKALSLGITLQQLLDEINSLSRNQKASPDGKPRRGRRPLPMTKGMRNSVSKRPIADKYRSPEGQTWSGLGRAPAWIASYTKEERKQFLIDPASSAPSSQ